MAETFNVNGGENEGSPESKPEVVTRRRGRPFGSRNRDPLQPQDPPSGAGPGVGTDSGPKPRKRRSKPVDLDQLAKKIQGAHMMMAMMTGIAEMQVSEPEAKMLAESLSDVAREFDMAPNGKAVAIVQLVGVSAIIYLPRMAMLQAKMRAAKQKRPVTVEGEKVQTQAGENSGPSAAN